MKNANSDKISIIAPIYNVEEYLERFIQSVLKQTYRNFELILVNDGSSDGSAEIIDKYVNLDKRIIGIHQNNQGVSEARNVGIVKSTGQWISFIDPDDYVSEDFLEIILDDVKKHNVELVQCCTENVDENGKVISYEPFNKNSNRYLAEKWLDREQYYFCRNKALARTVLYKKSIIDDFDIRFNKKYAICEDVDFVFRYVCNIEAVYIDTRRLYYYTIRHNSLTNSGGIKYSNFSALQYFNDTLSNDLSIKMTNGYYFSEWKVLVRVLMDEIKNVDSADNLEKKCESVEAPFVQVFGYEEFQIFKKNPIKELLKLVRNMSKKIDWKDEIPMVFRLLNILSSKLPFLIFKLIVKMFY